MNPGRVFVAALILGAPALVFALVGSHRTPAGRGEWLRGTVPEQTKVLEKHLRGLDVPMFEIGYRFTELYFAGQDGNWDYAKYGTLRLIGSWQATHQPSPNRPAKAGGFSAMQVASAATTGRP
jgi:hypothetical protein